MGGAGVTLVASHTMERHLKEISRSNAILLEGLMPYYDGSRHNRLAEIEQLLSRVLHYDPILGYALRTFVIDPVP